MRVKYTYTILVKINMHVNTHMNISALTLAICPTKKSSTNCSTGSADFVFKRTYNIGRFSGLKGLVATVQYCPHSQKTATSCDCAPVKLYLET